MSRISRRDFLVAAGGAFLLGCTPNAPPTPSGLLLGPDERTGHRLRDGVFPAATRHSKIPVLIAGAGIAGLSSGWWLKRNGYSDFRIIELEKVPGGNARHGHNEVSQYPWGAHYLPLPAQEAEYVRLLLADLDAIKGDPGIEAPVYDDALIVNAPDERLFINGTWQDGLLPRFGTGARALQEIDQFERMMQEWTLRKGKDGRHAFSIPSALSSIDPEITALDHLTMYEWMISQGFKSEALHWYVSYCCRDDYGANHHQVSAWAGLHYFCSRRGQASNADHNSVLTSPKGNGWIVEKLVGLLKPNLMMQRAVVRIETIGKRVIAEIFDTATGEVESIECEHLIWAAPTFVLSRVWSASHVLPQAEYAPWLVANITLRDVDEREYPVWDNVIYKGKGLGYVDATHQQLQYHRSDRVLTYYHAMDNESPHASRRRLLRNSHQAWTQQIFADLSKAHPSMQKKCTSVDIWRWPHAMAIPTVGFLQARQKRSKALHPRIHLAHSDLSGFSIFEEAQYRGVSAANASLRKD